jgi:hypothetical protein
VVEALNFQLPKNIERCLASLSKLYAQEGERALQELIVNAQTRVDAGYSYDNWNGGTHGHALHLVVPEPLFLAAIKQRDIVQKKIAEDINQMHNIQNEFIEEVFLEMEFRDKSDLLVAGTRAVSEESTKRLWTEGTFRLFLSHKSEVKRETAKLKENLAFYGISAFVAHDDIHPTRAWQEEIENALVTMDGFVALMTAEFHDSNWTDQEVGYALARGVPLIAVRLGRDPYGFLGKFQALSSNWDAAPEDIVKLLINNDRMVSAYISALRSCISFDRGNMLSRVLPSIEMLTDHQIDEMIDAFNSNNELQGSFGFSGAKPAYWGPGLVFHLHRLGSRRYVMSANFPRTITPDF